jgi:SAM-dependent methyltransferase
MKRKQKCPVCESERLTELYETVVPVLQNRVYPAQKEALESKKETMVLTHCADCSFVFNAAFDDQAIVYDENYDNSVPSKLFREYYEKIADYLYQKYRLQDTCVYDIGCGKGTFLKLLCSRYPDVKGIGIDPSYEGNLQPADNLQFIREFFKTEHVIEKPGLVISRHVFEHIEYPVSFLAIINEPLKDHADVPVFIEVPDFGWIVKNKTFWDICYEHCNYFSPNPIVRMFNRAGVELNAITLAFGDQYLWIEGKLQPSASNEHASKEFPSQSLNQIETFITNINANKEQVIALINASKENGNKIVVWGMATKGVIFSLMVDPERRLIDYCIDINESKQEQYIPGSGHQIHSPSILQSEKGAILVVVMNQNYTNEIKKQVASLSAKALFMDAHGNEL